MRLIAPSVPSYHPEWVPLRLRIGILCQLALLLMTMMGLYLFISIGGVIGRGIFLVITALGVPAAFLTWRWPIAGMTSLAVLGSIHPFLMLLLYHFTNSATVVKGAQLWKEIIVLILVAKVVDLAFRRRTAPVLYPLDLAVLLFLAYSFVYLFYPSSLQETSLLSNVLALRADTFFLLAYFIGRGVKITVGQVRIIIVLFMIVAFIISVVGVLQFAAPGITNVVFSAIGFNDYMELQRGDQTVIYAVRSNEIAGYLIPRASSLLLSDLALAFHMLLAMPFAAAFFLYAPHMRDKFIANILLLATAGVTVLTVTRSAIIATGPVLASSLLRPKGLPIAVLVALQVVAVAIPVTHALQITPRLLLAIFNTQEGSVQGHLEAFNISVEIIRKEPFGRGLGSAGQIAQRFDPNEGVTNESWYLQLATEMGVASAAMWAIILAIFGITSFVQYRRVRATTLKVMCLAMVGATIGFAGVSFTLHVWEAETTSIIFWLFAGLVVQARNIESPEEEVAHAYRRLA